MWHTNSMNNLQSISISHYLFNVCEILAVGYVKDEFKKSFILYISLVLPLNNSLRYFGKVRFLSNFK